MERKDVWIEAKVLKKNGSTQDQIKLLLSDQMISKKNELEIGCSQVTVIYLTNTI